jgi:hypothetical protein
MTERDYRNLRKMLIFLPVISIAISLLIQWGSWQANSANLQKQFVEQKCDYDKRFEKVEREKADQDVVDTKFGNIDWKLDLIMKNFGILYTDPPQKIKKR